MRRRSAFWLLIAAVGLMLVVVLGTLVFWLLDEEGVFGLFGQLEDDAVAYFLTFGLAFLDALIPIFPGETTLTAASTMASQGTLELELVILAGRR